MMPTYYEFGIIPESSYGVLAAASLQRVNVSSLVFSEQRNAQQPSVLSGDARQFPGRVLQKSGQITAPMNYQYENDLTMMESLYCSSRSSAVSVSASTIDFSSVTNKVSDSGNGLGSFANGDMVYVTGAGAGANAGQWVGPIYSKAAGEFTVPSGQLTTVAAGSAVVLRTRRLVDGDTEVSFSAQWKATKLTNRWRYSLGNVTTEARWRWEQSAYMTAEYSIMGQVPVYAAATQGTGADTAAPTSGFMNCVDDFHSLRILGTDGAALTQIVSSLGLTVTRNRPAIYELGSVGPSSFDIGRIACTVEGVAIYDDNSQDLADAVESHDTLTVISDWIDPQANHMCFVQYAVKADQGEPEIGEADSAPSTIPFRFSAHDPAKDTSAFFNSKVALQCGAFWCPQ